MRNILYRWFKPGDVDMIEEDMEDLRALFHAEGDGLEVAEVQQMCMGVQDLLTVLQLETEILIDNLKQVSLIMRYFTDERLLGLQQCILFLMLPSRSRMLNQVMI